MVLTVANVVKPHQPFRGTQYDRSHWMLRDLVGWWPMWEGGGGKAFDISGYQNHGTITNGPVWTGGRNGFCLDFDGSNDYVDLGKGSEIQPNGAVPLSVTCWMRIDANGHKHIMSNDGNSGAYGWGLSLTNTFSTSHRVNWKISSSATAGVTVTSATFNRTVGWIFVAGTYDPNKTTMQLHLLGAVDIFAETLSAPSSQFNETTYGNARIGARGQLSAYFNGRIADARIFNRALTLEQCHEICRNPWAPFARRPYEAASGGSTTVTVNDATHGHTADSPAITQTHEITVAESSHSHAADSPAITQTHEITVAESSHSHAADSPAITQTHEISVNEALHVHAADNITVTTGVTGVSSSFATAIVNSVPKHSGFIELAEKTKGWAGHGI